MKRKDPAKYYPRDYNEARTKFLAAASRLKAHTERYVTRQGRGEDETQSIDVARFGSSDPKWSVVTTSGLHGVEGFFGSAIQTFSMMDELLEYAVNGGGEFVFIHSLNPYGFANLRRVNENNIDLNRNFLLPSEPFAGLPSGYIELSPILNPRKPPKSYDLFYPWMLWKIWRLGLPALKASIAEGQYEIPEGLFFGGEEPAIANKLIQMNLLRLVRGKCAVHLDFHSGLGDYAKYKLLVLRRPSKFNWSSYAELFGASLEGIDDSSGTAYKTRGDLEQFTTHLAASSGLAYHFFTAEFGTYSVLRVLRALRDENSAHFHGSRTTIQRAKAELLECFCPASLDWREEVLRQGWSLIKQAGRAAAQLSDQRS